MAPILGYLAVDQKMAFAQPMTIGTAGCLVILVIAVFLEPETKGKVLTAGIEAP